jgi:hypothetical protein
MTRKDWRRIALVACLLAGAAGMRCGAAAAAAIADPTLLPRDILAMRGEEANDRQLRLVFDKTEDGKAVAPLTVAVGADYFDVIDGPRQSIEDLKLHRRYVVDDGKRTLVNLSLFGEVMFRRVELLRRMEIAQAMKRQPNHAPVPESLDRFWIESELGITVQGRQQSREPIAEKQQGERIGFYYHGREVASFEASGRLIPDGLNHGYLAFLRSALPLHPVIARDIAAKAEIPARLQFISEASGKARTIVLTLKSVAVADAPFPLPRHLTLVLLPEGSGDPETALMRRILPDMIEATAGRAQGGPRSVMDYRRAIDSAIRRGQAFEAVLRLTELALQWGRDAAACTPDDGLGPCHPRREINRLIRDDPRSTALFKAAELEDGAPQKALAIWRGLDGQDVPGDYVVDIFLAQLLSKRDDRKAAAEAFAAAFAGNPYIPLLYRELGNHFARVSRLDLAWLCYDLGRALPHRRDGDALAGIDEVEREMVGAYPDLF